MSASDAGRLGLLMTQAKIVREAYHRGELTFDQYSAWLDDLRQPRGFWNRLTWALFRF